MGISTQPISQVVNQAANTGLAAGFRIGSASTVAYQSIADGTAQLATTVVNENSQPRLTESRATFQPATVAFSPGKVDLGKPEFNPPGYPSLPDTNTLLDGVLLPLPENILQPEGLREHLLSPSLSGDLVIPGTGLALRGMAVTAPTLSLNAAPPLVALGEVTTTPVDDDGEDATAEAAQTYVEVTLVGSATTLAGAVVPPAPEPGPGPGG